MELGLAYASSNRIPQAISELQKSLIAAGRYDHPLTCVAFLELGRIAFEQTKYEAAVTYFHEATISAAYFDRYDVLEEAFRLAAESYSLSGKKGRLCGAHFRHRDVFAQQSSHFARVAARLAGRATDDVRRVARRRDRSEPGARGTVGRHEMSAGALGCRVSYQAAHGAFHAGEMKPGLAALTSAMTYQKAASKRLFQIGLADAAFRSGGVTERIADVVLAEVLREPTPADWLVEPLDTMAMLSSPHPLPYEHWFELLLSRKDFEQSINVAERIRRHRFLAPQPLGGRLLALRWVLEGPAETLTQEAILQRQELLVRFPKYADLSRKSAELRTKIEAIPIAPAEEVQIKQQQELFAELTRR